MEEHTYLLDFCRDVLHLTGGSRTILLDRVRYIQDKTNDLHAEIGDIDRLRTREEFSAVKLAEGYFQDGLYGFRPGKNLWKSLESNSASLKWPEDKTRILHGVMYIFERRQEYSKIEGQNLKRALSSKTDPEHHRDAGQSPSKRSISEAHQAFLSASIKQKQHVHTAKGVRKPTNGIRRSASPHEIIISDRQIKPLEDTQSYKSNHVDLYEIDSSHQRGNKNSRVSPDPAASDVVQDPSRSPTESPDFKYKDLNTWPGFQLNVPIDMESRRLRERTLKSYYKASSLSVSKASNLPKPRKPTNNKIKKTQGLETKDDAAQSKIKEPYNGYRKHHQRCNCITSTCSDRAKGEVDCKSRSKLSHRPIAQEHKYSASAPTKGSMIASAKQDTIDPIIIQNVNPTFQQAAPASLQPTPAQPQTMIAVSRDGPNPGPGAASVLGLAQLPRASSGNSSPSPGPPIPEISPLASVPTTVSQGPQKPFLAQTPSPSSLLKPVNVFILKEVGRRKSYATCFTADFQSETIGTLFDTVKGHTKVPDWTSIDIILKSEGKIMPFRLSVQAKDEWDFVKRIVREEEAFAVWIEPVEGPKEKTGEDA